MSRYNQDLTVVVEFTVTLPREIWDAETELTFTNSDYSFYDADFVSETDDIVTAKVMGAFGLVYSNPDQVKESFAEYGNTKETDIMFGDYKVEILKDDLYNIIKEGI